MRDAFVQTSCRHVLLAIAFLVGGFACLGILVVSGVLFVP